MRIKRQLKMWHNVEQNTDNPCTCCGKTWMELRAGKVTGSVVGKAMANYGKAFGNPAKAAAVEIAVVELGGEPESNGYTNAHMERGHEQEPIARALYESTYFTDVTNGGFYCNGRTGSSPDGHPCINGLIEIKSVIKSQHYPCLKRNSYDPKYKWQLFHNLIESGREWIDYVSFCDTFPPDKKLFVSRIHREDIKEEEIKIKSRLVQFFEYVEEVKENIINQI